MIISDLCDEYSVLVSQNKAPAYGHDNINVPYGLVINDDGTLVAVRPLGDFSGKKPIHIISAPTRFPPIVRYCSELSLRHCHIHARL
jgi:CRISPR-associated protein Csd1